jgi:hypothetical protein
MSTAAAADRAQQHRSTANWRSRSGAPRSPCGCRSRPLRSVTTPTGCSRYRCRRPPGDGCDVAGGSAGAAAVLAALMMSSQIVDAEVLRSGLWEAAPTWLVTGGYGGTCPDSSPARRCVCTNPVSFGWMPSGLTGARRRIRDAAVAERARLRAPSARGAERHQDRVVLILPEGLPLAGEDADPIHRTPFTSTVAGPHILAHQGGSSRICRGGMRSPIPLVVLSDSGRPAQLTSS